MPVPHKMRWKKYKLQLFSYHHGETIHLKILIKIYMFDSLKKIITSKNKWGEYILNYFLVPPLDGQL